MKNQLRDSQDQFLTSSEGQGGEFQSISAYATNFQSYSQREAEGTRVLLPGMILASLP